MPRSRNNVRRRMQEAALELFLEKGYNGTSAAEIAARAGVTERTFFRHFPDKREVLFDEAELHARLGEAIARAPAELGPLRIVLWAFEATVTLFEENRPLAGPAQSVIAQTPALQERQLAKSAAVTRTVAGALLGRGVDPTVAALTASTGMAIAGHALGAWFEDESVPLADQFRRAFFTVENMPACSRRPAR